MAKAARGRGRKTAARKAPVPAKRKTTTPRLSSNKFRSLVCDLSVQELDELIKVTTGRKNEELASAKASFFDEVRARAASLGISLADIVGLGGGEKDDKAAGNRRAPATAKYRNPKTGETWSGRGRPARWITELEATGHKRQKFAI